MSSKRKGAEELFEALSKTDEALKFSSEPSMGVLDVGFLCRSIGSLGLGEPLSVGMNASVDDVMKELKEHKVGCVLVLDQDGALCGIFSERDFVLKVYGLDGAGSQPVSSFMTSDPVAEKPDATVAFALNLMSQGGFRHLPIVDAGNRPVGIISVKDVLDQIVDSYVNDLLGFELDERMLDEDTAEDFDDSDEE